MKDVPCFHGVWAAEGWSPPTIDGMHHLCATSKEKYHGCFALPPPRCRLRHRVYHSVADLQNDGGATQQSVHRLVDDQNVVLVVHASRCGHRAGVFRQP
jgi:hypothetical protein